MLRKEMVMGIIVMMGMENNNQHSNSKESKTKVLISSRNSKVKVKRSNILRKKLKVIHRINNKMKYNRNRLKVEAKRNQARKR